MKNSRVNKLIRGMEQEGLSQIIITSPASIFYLTGKWIHPGERMLALYLNKSGDHKMIINKLFPVYEDLGVEMIWYEDTENPIDKLMKFINKNEVLGIDKDWPARFLIQLINNNAAAANPPKMACLPLASVLQLGQSPWHNTKGDVVRVGKLLKLKTALTGQILETCL